MIEREGGEKRNSWRGRARVSREGERERERDQRLKVGTSKYRPCATASEFASEPVYTRCIRFPLPLLAAFLLPEDDEKGHTVGYGGTLFSLPPSFLSFAPYHRENFEKLSSLEALAPIPPSPFALASSRQCQEMIFFREQSSSESFSRGN